MKLKLVFNICGKPRVCSRVTSAPVQMTVNPVQLVTIFTHYHYDQNENQDLLPVFVLPDHALSITTLDWGFYIDGHVGPTLKKNTIH